MSLGYGSWRITSPLILTLMSFTVWLALVKLIALLRAGQTGRLSPAGQPDAIAARTPLLVAYAGIAFFPLALVGSQVLFGPTFAFFNAAVGGYGLAVIFGTTALTLYFTSGTRGLALLGLVLAAGGLTLDLGHVDSSTLLGEARI